MAGLVIVAFVLVVLAIDRRIWISIVAWSRDPLRGRPTLLSIGMVLSATVSLVFALLLILITIGLVPSEIDGRTVSGWEFFRGMSPLFVPLLWSGVVSIGIRFHKPWSRHAALIFWIMFFPNFLISDSMGKASFSQITFALMELTAFTLGAIWYLYFKSNVVKYYQSIKLGI